MEDVEKRKNLVKRNIGPVPSREEHGSMSTISVPLRSWDGFVATSTIPLHERQAVDASNAKVRDYIGLGIAEHGGYLAMNE
jgi:hypothetical protein